MSEEIKTKNTQGNGDLAVVSGSLQEHKQVIRDLLDMYIINVHKNGITTATITEALELTDRAVKLISKVA
jgi:hypothetical protein